MEESDIKQSKELKELMTSLFIGYDDPNKKIDKKTIVYLLKNHEALCKEYCITIEKRYQMPKFGQYYLVFGYGPTVKVKGADKHGIKFSGSKKYYDPIDLFKTESKRFETSSKEILVLWKYGLIEGKSSVYFILCKKVLPNKRYVRSKKHKYAPYEPIQAKQPFYEHVFYEQAMENTKEQVIESPEQSETIIDNPQALESYLLQDLPF